MPSSVTALGQTPSPAEVALAFEQATPAVQQQLISALQDLYSQNPSRRKDPSGRTRQNTTDLPPPQQPSEATQGLRPWPPGSAFRFGSITTAGGYIIVPNRHGLTVYAPGAGSEDDRRAVVMTLTRPLSDGNVILPDKTVISIGSSSFNVINGNSRAEYGRQMAGYSDGLSWLAQNYATRPTLNVGTTILADEDKPTLNSPAYANELWMSLAESGSLGDADVAKLTAAFQQAQRGSQVTAQLNAAHQYEYMQIAQNAQEIRRLGLNYGGMTAEGLPSGLAAAGRAYQYYNQNPALPSSGGSL